MTSSDNSKTDHLVIPLVDLYSDSYLKGVPIGAVVKLRNQFYINVGADWAILRDGHSGFENVLFEALEEKTKNFPFHGDGSTHKIPKNTALGCEKLKDITLIWDTSTRTFIDWLVKPPQPKPEINSKTIEELLKIKEFGTF